MEFFPKILTFEETRKWVEKIRDNIAKGEFGLWAVEIKQTCEFIGFAGLSVPKFQADFTPCIEIGWRFGYKHWGKGYAQEAACECLNFGFNKLNIKEIVSFTSAINMRSINVMKRIGMQYVKEFEHPNIERGSNLCKHVLYIKKNS